MARGVLCNDNRIPGAQWAGSRWIIPEDAEQPADARTKSVKSLTEFIREMMENTKAQQEKDHAGHKQ